MTGKSENIVAYTADEVAQKRRRGEGRTDWEMGHDEAMHRRRTDPEAPQPYEGWEQTVTIEPAQAREEVTLHLDRDVLSWLRGKRKDYQELINAVLRSYYRHERRKEP